MSAQGQTNPGGQPMESFEEVVARMTAESAQLTKERDEARETRNSHVDTIADLLAEVTTLHAEAKAAHEFNVQANDARIAAENEAFRLRAENEWLTDGIKAALMLLPTSPELCGKQLRALTESSTARKGE